MSFCHFKYTENEKIIIMTCPPFTVNPNQNYAQSSGRTSC